MRLILLIGCRHGEILGLRWKEVPPGRLDLEDSETGPRRVLLGEPAMAVLTRRHQRQQARLALVFPNPADPTRARIDQELLIDDPSPGRSAANPSLA